MEKHHKGFLIILFINIVVTALLQILYNQYVGESINIVLFQFVMIPLILVILNTLVIWKSKLTFYHYAMATFCGLVSSIIVYALTLFMYYKPAELPPGEIVLGADLVLIMFVAILQFIIVIALSFISLLISKFIFQQKHMLMSIRKKAHSNI